MTVARIVTGDRPALFVGAASAGGLAARLAAVGGDVRLPVASALSRPYGAGADPSGQDLTQRLASLFLVASGETPQPRRNRCWLRGSRSRAGTAVRRWPVRAEHLGLEGRHGELRLSHRQPRTRAGSPRKRGPKRGPNPRSKTVPAGHNASQGARATRRDETQAPARDFDVWRGKEMVDRGRIELPTPGFSVPCSTN